MSFHNLNETAGQSGAQTGAAWAARSRQLLQTYWGYPEFRPPQLEVITCLLQGRDALVVLPTGGGKSLCFQIPALVQPGLTVVVSPLVALMENQVQDLRDRQLPAALLHRELPPAQFRQTLQALAAGRLRLLYVAPETLLSPKLWAILCQPTLPVRTLVVDEAHCLAQWGETFRPAYYRLGAIRRSLLASKPPGTQLAIAAFTATANPQTQATIHRILQLADPAVFRGNPHRPNLDLTVQIAWTPRQRKQQLHHFLGQHPHQAGLIYVRTRRAAEDLAAWLQTQGFATAAYHAGLGPSDRRRLEQRWLQGHLPFVVCTNAFGMGLNHPSVRWIVHFQAPTLLAEYVQEVGRAGRDGKGAIALMLVSEPTGWLDPEDKQRHQFFAQQTQQHFRLAQALMGKLPAEGSVSAIAQQFDQGAIALSLLHSAGCLEWLDPFHYRIHQRRLPDQWGQTNYQAAQQMRQYLYTRTCRWQFILKAFGCATEAPGWRCGHCDRCRP